MSAIPHGARRFPEVKVANRLWILREFYCKQMESRPARRPLHGEGARMINPSLVFDVGANTGQGQRRQSDIIDVEVAVARDVATTFAPILVDVRHSLHTGSPYARFHVRTDERRSQSQCDADHSVTRLSVLTIIADGIERMSVEGGTTQ
jgi:hypothetical protein